MSIAIEAAEREAFETALARPTPEQIDEFAGRYMTAKANSVVAADDLKRIKLELQALVQTWGAVPPNAEKSRRLNGRLAEITLTKSDTITIVDERVETLKDALDVNGFGGFFQRLFTLRTRWEIVKGAEAALKEEQLPKRLAERVLNLFGRCIDVKAKEPSLTVTIANPEKPARKPRARKEASK